MSDPSSREVRERSDSPNPIPPEYDQWLRLRPAEPEQRQRRSTLRPEAEPYYPMRQPPNFFTHMLPLNRAPQATQWAPFPGVQPGPHWQPQGYALPPQRRISPLQLPPPVIPLSSSLPYQNNQRIVVDPAQGQQAAGLHGEKGKQTENPKKTEAQQPSSKEKFPAPPRGPKNHARGRRKSRASIDGSKPGSNFNTNWRERK